MGYETITGLVAREVNSGENDRYLTLLSPERGKVECFAKGIRSQKSKLASASRLLSYGEYKMYEKAGHRTLTSAKSCESFYSMRTDVVKYAYSAHFLDIACDIMVEEQSSPEAIKTLLNSLFVLAYRNMNPELVSRAYETRMLSLAGFAPETRECTICGTAIEEVKTVYFAPYGDGVVCCARSCLDFAAMTLSMSFSALRALRYFMDSDAGKMFNFQASEYVLSELSRAIPLYLKCHLGKGYDKLLEAEKYSNFERDIASQYKIT